ncbi:MAG: zinc-dependent metalloprotease [Bacteroidota bacterium]|nr:zinc-dependent metalloprotease [Bacteroidota bacterium]
MPKIIFIFLYVSCLSLLTQAQNLGCFTQLSAKQIENLRNFQQKLSLGQVELGKKSTQFVPIKIHIIGNSKGIGYYSISNLMTALCEINERFLPVGFHFYLAQTVNYINDDALNLGDLNAIYDRALYYKMAGAVNVFFHDGGNQWCGVYIGGIDVVFIKNSCQATLATTFAHELGHFFGLPHTFYGWEGGQTPSNIEKIDGSNCRTAGDGFCDTKADYVSQRWNCPLFWNLIDPNGVVFKPDSSLYMNYASDNCHSRFSQEQILTMQNDMLQRGIAKTSASTALLAAPNKVFPAPSDSGIISTNIPFTWRSVPGAFAYQLQVARFGDWNYVNHNQLYSDTFAQVNLFGNWPYAWRVKAISSGNTCSSFGSADTFFTREIPAGLAPISLLAEPKVFPNPVKSGQTLYLQNLKAGKVNIYDAKGVLKWGQSFEGNLSFEVPYWPAGIYIIKWELPNHSYFQRLLLSEN